MKQIYIMKDNLIKRIWLLILFAINLLVIPSLFLVIKPIQAQTLHTSPYWYSFPSPSYDYESPYYLEPLWSTFFSDWMHPSIITNFKADSYDSLGSYLYRYDQAKDINIRLGQFTARYNLLRLGPFSWLFDPYRMMIYEYINLKQDSIPDGDQSNNNSIISLDFQTIGKGNYVSWDSGDGECCDGKQLDEPTLFKIETQKAFEDFWSEHRGCIILNRETPLIDFEREIVIALFDNSESSIDYSIEIENLEIKDDNVMVKATKVSPAQIYFFAWAQPYHIIKTSKINKSFSLSLTNSITTKLDFQTIEKGDNSCYSSLNEPTLFKIETKEAFGDFWSEHRGDLLPDLEAPLIDFEKELVIAVIDNNESSGGYSIEIESLDMRDDTVRVNASKLFVGGGSNLDTQPYHIIKTSKINKSFSLSLTPGLNFQTIEKGSYGNGYKTLNIPTLFKIETQEAFKDFWSEHRERYFCPMLIMPDAPSVVDFEKEVMMVVIDNIRDSTDCSIEIESLNIKDDNVIVNTTVVSPTFGPLGIWADRQPYHIIKIPKTDKSFSLSVTPGVRNKLDFETIQIGEYFRECYTPLYSPTLFKVETQEALEAFWSKHKGCYAPVTEDTTIDFEKEVIIAVIAEDAGAYSIEINSLEMKDHTVIVNATKICKDAAGWWLAYSRAQPYHIIKTSKIDKPFILSVTNLGYEAFK